MSYSNPSQPSENPFTAEPQQLPRGWVDLVGRSINLSLDAASVQQDFAEAKNDRERAALRRLFSSAVDFVRSKLPDVKEYKDILEEVEASVKSLTILPPRTPVDDHIQRGSDHLLAIVDNIIAKQDLPCLGPEDQKREEADHGCRFICIFCHARFTRVSDLRGHLFKKHTRRVDKGYALQKQILDERHVRILTGFEPGERSRLQIFGQYTYEDVQENNWDIKDWNACKPRGPKGPASLRSKATASSKPVTKRKDRQRSYEESDERYTRNGPPPTVLAQPPRTPTSTTRSRSHRPSLSSRHISSVSTMPSSAQSWSQPPGLSALDPRLQSPTPGSENLSGQDLLGVHTEMESSTPSSYPAEVSMNSVEPALPLKTLLFHKAGEKNFGRRQV